MQLVVIIHMKTQLLRSYIPVLENLGTIDFWYQHEATAYADSFYRILPNFVSFIDICMMHLGLCLRLQFHMRCTNNNADC